MSTQHTGPLRLKEAWLTLAELAAVCEVPEKDAENWQGRRILDLGERFPNGRRFYSVLDALKLATMHGLTRRVPIGPTNAARAARVMAEYVLANTPRDDAGRALADFGSIPHTQALALAVINGEWRVDEVALGLGYANHAGRWGRAHIVVPIASLAADIIFRLFQQTPETAQ